MENSSNNFDVAALVRNVVPDLDMRIAEYRVDGIELDDELLAVFVEQLTENLAAINASLEDGDLSGVMSQAHSVKGMCGSIGVPELSVLGREIEIQAGQGASDACVTLVQVLETCLQGYQSQL